MEIKFSHVNLICRDWRKLADFYVSVLGCRPLPPERDLEGDWVDRLTGLKDARINGIHLLLPGYEETGPTLEIFGYNRIVLNENKAINLEGYGHTAFVVSDVEKKLEQILENGGSLVGELIEAEVRGAGKGKIVYARDPEGNIIELQRWKDE